MVTGLPPTRHAPAHRRGTAASLVLLATVAVAVAEEAPAPDPEVRITGAVIDLTLDPSTASLRCRASLVVEGSGASRLIFAVGESLAVERVTAGSGVVEYRRRGAQVVVDVDPVLDGPRTLTFLVSGTPRRNDEARIRPDRAVLGPEDGWIPLHPGTWGTADLTVHVPDGWVAMGPGRRLPTSGPGVWRWKSDRPLRHLAVAAAPGLNRTEAARGPLTVRVAAGPGGPSAEALADLLVPPTAWNASTFAPYPFDGFNVAVVPGLDRPTRGSGFVAVPADFPMRDVSDGAELLSGQWFAELLGGDGPWIEAWAAWEPVAFTRRRALPLPAETVRLREEYFRLLSGDVALAHATAGSPRAVLRGKGSAAPEMVRLGIGEEPFFAALADLFAGTDRAQRSLASFRARFVHHAPERAGPIFDEWFGRAGAPELSATLRTLRTADDRWRHDVQLVQERGTYTLPVELVFYGEGGAERRETVEIEDTKTTLLYVLPFQALRIEVDPLDRLFRWR